MKGITEIYFNDTLIGTTDKPVDYQRENDLQKEYRVTDIRRELSAVFYCEDVKIIKNDKVIVEIV